ncbi:MAG: hypothetical protein K2X81_09340 [Candidatus Obscuribacterales bacterium]|nr:hypothetical protein [Candidatus Obscuribacterales bacterium]
MIVVRHKFIAGRGKGKGAKVVAIGKAIAHMKYIQHRPGPDKEKGGREMFNEREQVDAQEMREAIKELGGSRVVVHKLTLAPEINPADKKAFTREVMQELSRDKGLDLNWFAVEHNNTDHHHIHVVVLGKDRNGSEVRIDLKDIDKVKEYGDRYLERWHPREMERSRREREDREKERRAERSREREAAKQERISEGRELPWLHQKIIREQLEPFQEWKEKQDQRDKLQENTGEEKERPYHQDTIEAAGREWSKANNLQELRDLNEHLWDNYEERIPLNQYKKLVAWIKEKEQLKEPEKGKEESKVKERRDEFEYQGNKYSKKDSYEKLTGVAAKLREGEERLPFEDYQKLRGWIEYKDRERWSGALGKEIERTHEKFERSKTMQDLKAAEGGRVLDPLQEQLMSNPIVGLFMAEAAIASEIVRSIPLDDRNRDYMKEARDELLGIQRDIEEKRRNVLPWEKALYDQSIEKLEKGIEEIERKRAEEERNRKRGKERGRDDWDKYDPYGRF